MRPYCPAIRHFLDCHGNISSLRRSLTFKARWSDRLERHRLERRLHNDRAQSHRFLLFLLSFSFSFSPPLPIFFQPNLSHIINLLLHSLRVGQYRGIFSSQVMYCPSLWSGQYFHPRTEYFPPSHAIIYMYCRYLLHLPSKGVRTKHTVCCFQVNNRWISSQSLRNQR